MPFWTVLDHDAIMRLVTICTYLGGVLLAVFALWVAYQEVDDWEWDLHKKPEESHPKMMLAIQATCILVYFGGLPIAAWILGSEFGALLGLALGYAGIPIAFVLLMITGGYFVVRHMKCPQSCNNDESDQASTKTPAS